MSLRAVWRSWLLLIVLGDGAWAQVECPTEGLDISVLTHTADAIWQSRQTAQQIAVRRGMDAAVKAVPGRLQSVSISAGAELSTNGMSAHEYTGAATFAIALGELTSTRKAVFGAQKRALAVGLDLARWRFVDDAQDTYLIWRQHALERAHLEAYLTEANVELEPIRKAGQRHLISRIDQADLEAEVAWVHAELSVAIRRTTFARNHLDAILGIHCTLAPVTEASVALDGTNPWLPLVDRVAEFPELRVSRARQAALQAQVKVYEASSPWVLGAGVTGRTVGLDEYAIGPMVSLTIPLGIARSATERARVEVTAEATAGEWAAARLHGMLVAEAANFDAIIKEHRALETGYVGPLKRRAELMNTAFKASQIQIDRLIRTRRELHEAEHKLVLHRAEIEARHLKATAIGQLLSKCHQNEEKQWGL